MAVTHAAAAQGIGAVVKPWGFNGVQGPSRTGSAQECTPLLIHSQQSAVIHTFRRARESQETVVPAAHPPSQKQAEPEAGLQRGTHSIIQHQAGPGRAAERDISGVKTPGGSGHRSAACRRRKHAGRRRLLPQKPSPSFALQGATRGAAGQAQSVSKNSSSETAQQPGVALLGALPREQSHPWLLCCSPQQPTATVVVLLQPHDAASCPCAL